MVQVLGRVETHQEWLNSRGSGAKLPVINYDLPLPLSHSFAVLQSNLAAFEMAAMFAQGIHHFCAVVGPSGWGKTHLMNAVMGVYAREMGVQPELHLTSAWLATQPRAESIPVLLLDHAEDAFSQARTRQALRTLMERRKRLGKPTFLSFSHEQPQSSMRQLLQGRDWVITEIQRPARSERIHVVRQLAKNHDLQLSQKLIGLVARRVVGNGNSLDGALRRLALCGSEWNLPTEELGALGILEPLLSMRKGWDLRDHVTEVAQRIEEDPARAQDLASFAMVRWLRLHESDVAAYFGSHTNDLYTSLERCKQENHSAREILFERLHQSIDRL